ncbi:glycoside hydrolase family 16 protein [Cristinia sonorae]|uniref:Glycoside hydrolase family 16 protein n=1 Tax=Cristinia sonorae TaxID=1940300 RepID=A0A8K0UU44_9AGAR|nr:glycoside hydrolase family 16 protein [Cristinia sonorae]
MLSMLPSGMLACLQTPSKPPKVHSAFLRAAVLSLAVLATLADGKALEKRSTLLETSANGTQFIWTIQDTYAGKTFFDTFDFFTGKDPTNGRVNYTDRDTAFAKNLAFVEPDGTVIMKGDNTTWLGPDVYRNSVRISSRQQYNTGLFILDLNKAPWGCGVWPAWWTLGSGQWPLTGEIDIFEGVHDNEHNQVTWHTGPNCTLTPNDQYTGSLVVGGSGQPNLICDGNIPGNAGCGITEWSRASYGPSFDAQGGGVFAMKWDDTGIAVWSFYRAAVPKDIQNGQPAPSTWGRPVAVLLPTACDPIANFINHSIIFDITFCGDWAGNSYATSGCPGTCPDRLIDPSNFDEAWWSINWMKVYKRQPILTQTDDARYNHVTKMVPYVAIFSMAALIWL